VSTGTIHYWVNAGCLAARRGPAGRWAIPFPPSVEAACRERATGSARQHRDTDPAPRHDGELSIADVARRLGVKPDVIYSWAEWGHIPARRGQDAVLRGVRPLRAAAPLAAHQRLPDGLARQEVQPAGIRACWERITTQYTRLFAHRARVPYSWRSG
jgi:hypothetical protein